MIELTEDQMRALSAPHATPPRLVNPQTHEAFVLLRIDEYQRLTAEAYDDGPWTRDELQALSWEAGNRTPLDGEDDDEAPETP